MNSPRTDHASTAQRPPDPNFGAAFVTTQWTAVLTAGEGDTTRARAALEQLCRNYWPPL